MCDMPTLDITSVTCATLYGSDVLHARVVRDVPSKRPKLRVPSMICVGTSIHGHRLRSVSGEGVNVNAIGEPAKKMSIDFRLGTFARLGLFVKGLVDCLYTPALFMNLSKLLQPHCTDLRCMFSVMFRLHRKQKRQVLYVCSKL